MKDRLKEVKKKSNGPLRQATLCFLIKENQILLGMKKRGFAAGKWNGAGGKPKDTDKTIKETAIRETEEEIFVTPINLKKVATLNFYHLGDSESNQKVIVYVCDAWKGEPKESEELFPQWFNLDEIPYDKMWDDDKMWIPLMLEGKKINADFLFDESKNMIEHLIKEL